MLSDPSVVLLPLTKQMAKVISKEFIEQLLQEIPDPEIPVISIVDLGIVRSVILENEKVVVNITPTYSGCPAMMAIQKDIVARLKDEGIEHVEVNLVMTKYGLPTGSMTLQRNACANTESLRLKNQVRIKIYLQANVLRWLVRAVDPLKLLLSASLGPRPVKHCIDVNPVANLLITSNVTERKCRLCSN